MKRLSPLLFPLVLLAGVARAQPYPVLSKSTITASGSRAVTGLASAELDLVVSVTGTVSGTSPSLTFTVAESDPQVPTSILTGGLSISTAAITAAGSIAPLHISPFGSSAVLVSWAVTGTSPSFGGVNVSLVNRSAIAGGGTDGVQIAGDGGTLPVVGVGGTIGTTTTGDGGTQPVVVVGQTSTVQTQIAGDGGVQSVNIVGATGNVPVNVNGVVNSVQSGNWGVLAYLDAGIPDTVSPSVAVNVVDGGCLAPLAGEFGAGLDLAAGTLAATLIPEVSYNGGATWVNTQFQSPTGTLTSSLVVTNPNAETQTSIVTGGGQSTVRVVAVPYTSGTANCTIRTTQAETWTGATTISGTVGTTTTGDGGTQPVVVVGQSAPLGVYLQGDGGVLAVYQTNPSSGGGPITISGDGGTLPVVIISQPTQSVTVYGDGGTLPVVTVNSQTLNYSTTSPVPVDNSAQSQADGGVVLCANGPATAIPNIGTPKVQDFFNGSLQTICLGDGPAFICPPEFDAGPTVVAWMQLPPGGWISLGDGLPHYCQTSSSALVSPDAGLGWHDAR